MSTKKLVSSIDSFLWLNRYIMEFLGFWPPEPGTSIISKNFAAFRIVFSIFAVSFLFVPEVMMVIVFWGDIDILTGVGCVSLTIGQLIFKMLYVLARRHKFCQIYRKTCELWSMTDHESELRQGLEKLAGQAKKVSIAFLLTSFCNNINFTTRSVVVWLEYNSQENKSLVERRLPFDVWFGFNLQRTPNFEIVFFGQSVSAIYCCVGIVGLDSTLMTLILHICGHFRVISARLRNIGQRMYKEDCFEKSACLHLNSKLAMDQCIQYHQQIIKFAEDVRTLLSPIIFVQLLTSGLEVCLSGYVVIVNAHERNYGELIRCTSYFLSVFIQLIIWCWPGQLLIQDSSEIGRTVVHELPWWNMTVEQQRQFVCVIIRSQKECQITALDFQVMSMSKFTDVFNTAGSYLALLRTVYEKQNED